MELPLNAAHPYYSPDAEDANVMPEVAGVV